MGNRITRAAGHLPADAVQERMQAEACLWRRQRWEIISQALTDPRQAEDIARTVGVSLSTVHRVIAMYKQGGVAAIETPGKGGRRHQYLTLSQERAFLQPFVARATRGEMATAVEIKLALEAQIGHEVNKSTLYRLLDRHGWRQQSAASSRAQTRGGKRACVERVPVSKQRKPQSPSRESSRQQAPQRYPSDLTDQEWVVLQPLIPPARARRASSNGRYACA